MHARSPLLGLLSEPKNINKFPTFLNPLLEIKIKIEIDKKMNREIENLYLQLFT